MGETQSSDTPHDPVQQLRAFAEILAVAVQAVRHEGTRDIMDSPEGVQAAIGAALGMTTMCSGVIDQMILKALERDEHGRSMMSLRQLAGIFGLSHGAIQQRHAALKAEQETGRQRSESEYLLKK